MKIKNITKNTLYSEDIDTFYTYVEGRIETIDPDILKKSKCLRSLILNNSFEIIEHDPKETVEASIAYMKSKIQSQRPIEKKKKKPNPEIKISKLTKCKTNIEVKIHGIFLDASGYGKVNRSLARKLNESGVTVKIEAKRSQNQLSGEELKDIVKLEKTQLSNNHIRIDSIIPSFAEISSGKYRVLYTTIESYTVPKQFVECCNTYNEIWVVSKWNAEILKKYVKVPIYVIPTGVDIDLYKEKGPSFDFSKQLKKFVFVSVFGWSYRKGYDVMLKSYFEEFNKYDDVSLLIVSRYQSGVKKFHRNKIKDDIDRIISQYPNHDLPHISRYSNILREEEMPLLYRAADCFILCSRGEGNCAVKGTKIITDCGLVPVENIKVIDKVLTHTGSFKKVTKIMSRTIKEKIYSIKTSLNIDSICLTAEHPVLVLKKEKTLRFPSSIHEKDKSKFNIDNCEWVIPSSLSVDDYVVCPINFSNKKNKTHINTSKYLDKNNIIITKNTIYRKGRNQYNSNFSHPNVNPLPKRIEINSDFLRLLGFYISEGWSVKGSRHKSIGFAFHKDEITYINEVKKYMLSVFNQIIKGFESNDKVNHPNRYTLCCDSSLINELFTSLCGSGSHSKHLPDFVYRLSKDRLLDLIYGIFSGDGCFYVQKNSKRYSPSLSLSTVSKQLANEVVLILKSIGISSCLQKKKNRGYLVSIKGTQLNKLNFIKNSCYNGKIKEKSVIKNDYIFIPIREITTKKYTGMVYNLEVEDDHSYATNCFVVHNCLPPLEASSCGLPVIMTNCSGQQQYLTEDNSYRIEIDRLGEIQPGQMHVHFWDGQKFPLLISDDVIKQTRQHMRSVYSNYEEAKEKNLKMQELIREEFTWNNTGNAALKRLKEIKKKIDNK